MNIFKLFKSKKETIMKYQVISKDDKGKLKIYFINGGKKDLPVGDNVTTKIAEAYVPMCVEVADNDLRYLDIVSILLNNSSNNIINIQDIIMRISKECYHNIEYLNFIMDDISSRVYRSENTYDISIRKSFIALCSSIEHYFISTFADFSHNLSAHLNQDIFMNEKIISEKENN